MIFSSLSPDLRNIKGTKLECISCQINNVPLEVQPSLTMQPFHNHGLDIVHNQGTSSRNNQEQEHHVIMETLYLLFQEVLLGSYNRAGPAYSDPSNYFRVCKPVVFHDITGYQGPCSSKTSCKKGKHNKKYKIQQMYPQKL